MLSKIVKLKDLVQKINTLRESGRTIVFTNGCFDILHIGHVRYLAAARSEGDVLVVGLNSDESTRSIKQKNRPIVSQDQRAEVLAGLECVDYITVFNEPDPLKLIQALKPDVLVKGADWRDEDIIGADVVKESGGKVVRVDVVPDISTSRIIQRILKRHQHIDLSQRS
jgi:D-beta-D-heptose 7-phosphate kinase/D-beta-D-heptose 1-phosphate adenosyltransferase